MSECETGSCLIAEARGAHLRCDGKCAYTEKVSEEMITGLIDQMRCNPAEHVQWIVDALTELLDARSELFAAQATIAELRAKLEAVEKDAERRICKSIIATQDGATGRLVCDVERLLHHFNAGKAALAERKP